MERSMRKVRNLHRPLDDCRGSESKSAPGRGGRLDTGRLNALSRFTTMWSQNYTPVAGSLGLSSLVAAIPIFVLLFLLGVKRKPAWIAALSGLAAAAAAAIFGYGMPLDKLLSAV